MMQMNRWERLESGGSGWNRLLLVTGLCLGGWAGGPQMLQAQPEAAQDVPVAGDPAPPRPASVPAGSLIMDFRQATLDTVLNYLSEEAGLIVVSDLKLDRRIDVVSRQPVTLEEAINLLNSVLLPGGHTAVRRERLLRIVPLDQAKVQSIPVRYGTDPDQIGQTDTVITQILPIRFAKAAGLAQNLRPLIGGDYAELAANESSNALILTDTEANVRRIAAIVQALDRSISQVTEVRVFQLQYANATDTARLITDIFDGGRNDAERLGQAIQNRWAQRRPGPQAQPDQQEATGQQNRGVSAAADERTNNVVVSAAPDLMVSIAEVVRELDSDTSAKDSVLIYRVRNMQASTLEEIFNDLFQSNLRNNRTTTTTQGAARTGATGGRGAQVQAATRGGQAGGGRGAQTAAQTAVENAAADLVGQVSAKADAENNALLVLTQEKNFSRVREILEVLDQPVPQVLIRVLVSEVTYNDNLDLGVEFEAINVGSTTSNNVLSNFNLFESALGLNVLLFDSDNLRVAIRALQGTGRFNVLSRPYLLTANNQQASITVGSEVPFVTDSRVTDSGDTISSVEYKDVGITLTVTPQINSEGLVVLDVLQEIKKLTEETIPISERLAAQIITQRRLETKVAVAGGQTIVIGGLMEDQLQENVRKVPILGDIPLVGMLFRRTQREKVKTELLLFLSPEVVTDPSQLSAASARIQENSSREMGDAIEPGLMQKHLEEMRPTNQVDVLYADPLEAATETAVDERGEETPARRAPRRNRR